MLSLSQLNPFKSFSVCDPFRYYSTVTPVSIVVSPGLMTVILSTFLIFNVRSASHIECTSVLKFISSELMFL